MARRCPVCETVFTVAYRYSRQVFCSPTCKAANRNNKPARQTCPACENEFTTTVARRRTYCSEECRNAARTSDDIREQRVCPVCDGPFATLKTTRQIYCSPACRKDAERRRDQARDEDRARRLAETTPLPSRAELPPPPEPSAGLPHANQWLPSVTRWNRPRPGAAPTATSRSPLSRFLRPLKPPAPPSPPQALTSSR